MEKIKIEKALEMLKGAKILGIEADIEEITIRLKKGRNEYIMKISYSVDFYEHVYEILEIYDKEGNFITGL